MNPRSFLASALCIAASVSVMPRVVVGAEVWGASNGDFIMHYPIGGGASSVFPADLPAGSSFLTDLVLVGNEVWGATNGDFIMRYPIGGGLPSVVPANEPVGSSFIQDLVVIPEPSALILAACALLGLACGRRQ